ncbi:MAG: HD domain-containing protein [Planctomycetes bacterium]|nr:HD domain-containing protein [Planctomycetota bacterium]MCB9885411.1 HD domain-containing protein [Planctomycetota bacterium]
MSTVAKTNVTTQATQLVDELVVCLVNAKIYASSHPRVRDAVQAVLQRLHELVEESRNNPVCLGVADGLVVFDQRPLMGASIGAARLVQCLEQWGSGGLELWDGASATELEELLTGIGSKPQPGKDYTWLNTQLVAKQCRNLRLLPPYDDGLAGAERNAKAGRMRVGVQFYQTVVDLLQSVTVSVCRGGRIDFAPVQAHAEQVLAQLESKDAPVLGLARQDQYDAFTFGHSVRVAVLAMNFARELTDDRELLIRIGTAALLHDVGKSLIPFELLHSQNALSAEERRVMDTHAPLGAECLLDHADSDPLAIAAAFGHHRGPGGTGYPRTLHEHETTMVTSIVKICDIYEALTAARPYKRPMSPIRAYRVMIAMGDKLDQRLLNRFVQINGIFPIGQHVKLDDGAIAVVRSQSQDPQRPVVELLDPADGDGVAAEEEQLLDLSDVSCCAARSILLELTPDRLEEERQPAAPRPEPAEDEPAAARKSPLRWD